MSMYAHILQDTNTNHGPILHRSFGQIFVSPSDTVDSRHLRVQANLHIYIYIYVRIQVTRLWIRGAFAFRPVLHRPSWTDVPIQVLRLIFLNPRFHAHPGTRQRKKTKLNKGESFDCKLPGDPFALWVTWKPFVERCLLDVQVAVAYVLITVHRCTPQSSSKRWLPKACPPLYRGQ